MRVAILILLCILGFTTSGSIGAQPDDKADVENELQKFQGTWAFVFKEESGAPYSADALKKWTCTYEGNRYTIKDGDKVIDVATIKLDPSKSPKTYAVVEAAGAAKGKVRGFGIYEISGDTLKECWAEAGKQPPTEFKTAVGSGTTLVILKRVKK